MSAFAVEYHDKRLPAGHADTEMILILTLYIQHAIFRDTAIAVHCAISDHGGRKTSICVTSQYPHLLIEIPLVHCLSSHRFRRGCLEAILVQRSS